MVVGDPPAEQAGHQPFSEKVRAEAVDHLAEDQPRLPVAVGPRQHLPGREAVPVAAVVLDVRHGDRFDAPGVVDQDLAVDPEGLIEEFLVPEAAARHLAHRLHVRVHQAPGRARPDLPEIRQRLMVPKQIFVGFFVQFGDADAVPVGGTLLGDDIHGYLG